MWVRLCMLLLLAPAVLAAESDSYNRISISVSSSAEIVNNILTVNLLAQADEDLAADATKKVNTAMQKALKKLKSHPGIKVKTLNYRTYPMYREAEIISWHAEHGMRLESDKISELAALTGELQTILSVTEMNYKTSPSERSKKENELIVDTISAFEERATIVTNSLGAQRYRIVKMRIDTQGRFLDIPHYETRATKIQGAESPVKPSVLAGTQVILVTATGEIEVLKPRS